MGVGPQQRKAREYRGQMPSPGRPAVAWREDRVRFWAAIARGFDMTKLRLWPVCRPWLQPGGFATLAA